jgi:hypothetical protein
MPATLTFTATADGYRLVNLTCTGSTQAPITGALLRDLPIQQIASGLFIREAGGQIDTSIPAELLTEWPRGDVGPLLERVRAVRDLAIATGQYPMTVLQQETGMSRATVNRMVNAIA